MNYTWRFSGQSSSIEGLTAFATGSTLTYVSDTLSMSTSTCGTSYATVAVVGQNGGPVDGQIVTMSNNVSTTTVTPASRPVTALQSDDLYLDLSSTCSTANFTVSGTVTFSVTPPSTPYS